MPFTLGISTSGGDAPGLNACIEAVTTSASTLGWGVLGIRNGFDGILAPDHHPAGGVLELTAADVRGIGLRGGSILGCGSRGFPAMTREYARELASMLRAAGLDALVLAGGDGSHRISAALAGVGFPVVGVPKTIDNDLDGTTASMGFATAVAFTADMVGRLRSTAHAHRRVMLLEVMGRNAGWIALHGAIAAGADGALLPEIPYRYAGIREFAERGLVERGGLVLVVAEGSHPAGSPTPGPDGLGGVGEELAQRLRGSGVAARSVTLGHLLRGGDPVAEDRLLGHRVGTAAVESVRSGTFGVLLGWDGAAIRSTSLAEVAGRCRQVPLDGTDLAAARQLGLHLGQ